MTGGGREERVCVRAGWDVLRVQVREEVEWEEDEREMQALWTTWSA